MIKILFHLLKTNESLTQYFPPQNLVYYFVIISYFNRIIIKRKLGIFHSLMIYKEAYKSC